MRLAIQKIGDMVKVIFNASGVETPLDSPLT